MLNWFKGNRVIILTGIRRSGKDSDKTGTTVVIANGKKDNVLLKVLNNEDIGTIFYAEK